MLDGCTPWPAALEARYRAAGYREGLTLWAMVARTVARLPDKVALVAGARRETYADLDRASARLGWYAHAMVYLAVNAVLMLMAFGTGRTWALFPALGWGLGLAIHGVVVYLVTGGAGLYDRLIQRERDQLAARRDQP